jgi:hypothetical protein
MPLEQKAVQAQQHCSADKGYHHDLIENLRLI